MNKIEIEIFNEYVDLVMQIAKYNSKRTFLGYNKKYGFFITQKYFKKWLLQAYPGGRTILSVRGGNLINNNEK